MPRAVIKIRCEKCRRVLDVADVAMVDGRFSVILTKPTDALSTADARTAARIGRPPLKQLRSRPSIRKEQAGEGRVRWGCPCGRSIPVRSGTLATVLHEAARANAGGVLV